jgi:hypothetical protein
MIILGLPWGVATPEATRDEPTEEQLLLQAYEKKLANPKYVAWISQPGLPVGYQAFEEEALIKSIRARIARNLNAPTNARIVHIPVAAGAPVIDGRLDNMEWIGAAVVPMEPPHQKTRLMLLSDGKRLFLGADVPDEVTRDGFDQFRFYYHVLGSNVIVNERIHVGIHQYNGGGLRETTVRWHGAPPANDDERWKKFQITDWQIYRHFNGKSFFDRHRQYEAVLDLEEVGLHVHVPFPAFVEVETDPTYRTDGKFGNREYLGFLGSQNLPAWFIIDPTFSKKDGAPATNLKQPTKEPKKIYKWVDSDGNITFSDKPQTGADQTQN